ncbi:PREDICTED: golgin subfamily A member 6-like protein 2 isoform X2 [Acropora digitifera]|uniref:golgin subfamily A member 6-like protein 2 isoform X2 n=1 Tax=Acropora digitifera TaxID=70779 RepID=UPI00077AECBC|nr:PREDICTED: golgin subfamily A member 6-like protein 2 isoform X2 [Acropora digitifera]XP_015750971.1 PREDICTED: golgin subfamily A member 6-like protein 2 isoform X2 [Acropora digitifera]XP_015750972.1 PREDICTED: golgin subfamily A member 6-like protein 2 isoform X2 [Acropora digitifera]
MEQKHRTILRHQWSNIRDNLEPNNILPKLVLVLRETDEEEIREQSTRQERCDKLLYILPTRGENAFNVFVNALVKEAPHLASELTEADTKTEDELNHAREKSANLRGEIRKLKRRLEAEKQNHEKTLQELKKLKSLHGKGNETKGEITRDGLQKKKTTTESLSQKEQDQTRQKENFKREDERLLQKCDYLDEKNKQSKNREAAKEKQEKRLQRENKQLTEKVAKKTLEFEKILAREQQMKKKLKDSLEKCQAQTKDKDVLLKKMRLENKRLHEQSNAERSKCDTLSEEVRRLKEISGHEPCSRCATSRDERSSAMTEIQTLRKEIQELNKGVTKINKDYQPSTQTPHEWHQSPQEKPINLPREHRKVEKKHQEEIKYLQEENKRLEYLDNSKKKLEQDLLKSQRDLEKLKKDFACENKRMKKEIEAKDDLLKLKLKDETHMSNENYSLREKLKEEISKSSNLKKEVHRLRLTPKEMQGQIYSYSGDFDKRGVVYHLARRYGKTSQVNPSSTQIVVTRSSDREGHAEDLLKNQVKRGIVSGTKDKEGSSWCVDLTEKYVLFLTHYTLRHGREKRLSVLLNWRLEASLDGRRWTTLKNHEDDHGLKKDRPYCTCTWAIDGDSNAFRYFRIFQTGKNSSDDENVTVVDNASLKQGYAGLVTLILEAVKMT